MFGDTDAFLEDTFSVCKLVLSELGTGKTQEPFITRHELPVNLFNPKETKLWASSGWHNLPSGYLQLDKPHEQRILQSLFTEACSASSRSSVAPLPVS